MLKRVNAVPLFVLILIAYANAAEAPVSTAWPEDLAAGLKAAHIINTVVMIQKTGRVMLLPQGLWRCPTP